MVAREKKFLLFWKISSKMATINKNATTTDSFFFLNDNLANSFQTEKNILCNITQSLKEGKIFTNHITANCMPLNS